MRTIKLYIKKLQGNNKCNIILSRIFNFTGVKRSVRGQNVINYDGAYLKKVVFKIKGKNNTIEIDKLSLLINCKIIVEGSNNKISIGKVCVINNTTFSILEDRCTISIGSETTINGANFIAGGESNIIVGEDCMFSSNIEVRNTDSHDLIDLKSKNIINSSKDINISNHVWIGNSCALWKGCNIGSNSVIGYGTFISKKYSDNCLIVGFPGKVVKENIDWKR